MNKFIALFGNMRYILLIYFQMFKGKHVKAPLKVTSLEEARWEKDGV